MSSIYVARQPIFEHGKRLYGYELLYRRNATIEQADHNVEHMSADVIVGALLGLGINTVAGSDHAFVNFSREQLLGRSWQLFDRRQVVIELLEGVTADQESVTACRELVEAGYTLALDDYWPNTGRAEFLELASIVKVDVLHHTREQLNAVALHLRPYDVRLLAERVETAATRDMCANLGYELFQGYLFSRPETLSKNDIAAGQIAIMRLLDLVQNPLTSDRALEGAFQTDIALCYKLLRMVNAAAIGGVGIASIQHAVRLIGRRTLHQWLAVIFVASLAGVGEVTREIALTAITRARMCELLMLNSPNQRQSSSAFIVGLLSLLDVLLEVPMERILTSIDLSAEIRIALGSRQGALGKSLALVEAYERGAWEKANELASACGISDSILPQIYLESLQWATHRLHG